MDYDTQTEVIRLQYEVRRVMTEFRFFDRQVLEGKPEYEASRGESAKQWKKLAQQVKELKVKIDKETKQ